MMDLIAKYTVEQIIVYAAILALAIKGVVEFIKWCQGLYKDKFNEDYNEKTKEQYCEVQIGEFIQSNKRLEQKLDNITTTMNEKIDKIEDQLTLLSSSSRNDIKAWMVETHHKCMKEESIDDFTKDVVERRFEDYEKLGGNSYIKNLVSQMRELPIK